MASTKRQVSFFELLEEAEYAKNADKETASGQNSAFRGELAVLLSIARAQPEWEVLAGVPGDETDLGRFFRVAVPRASLAALAYREAKGLSMRRRAAREVFATKACWVLPDVSGMDLLQPWPANAYASEAKTEHSEESFESDFEEDPADFEAKLAELSSEATLFIRSGPPDPSEDPNFAPFPILLKDCEHRPGSARTVDMSVVKDSHCTLADIGKDMLESASAKHEDGFDNINYSLHDIGTCCLRASKGPAPKTSGDMAVVPSHGFEGPPRWADEPVDALAGPWDVSSDVRGLWPKKEELELEADVMEPVEWQLRPDVLKPTSKKRRPWNNDFVNLGWQVLPAPAALELSADGLTEGPPRLPLERLWRNAQRREVDRDFLIASLQAEQALADVSGESLSADVTAMLQKFVAIEVAASDPNNNGNNVSPCKVSITHSYCAKAGQNLLNRPGIFAQVSNSGPNETSKSIAGLRTIPACVSHMVPRRLQSSKVLRDRQKTQDSVKLAIAAWKKSNPGRPAYEVLAAHRRIPRWRDYDSRGLAAWLDRFRRNLREAACELELSVSLPRFQFTPRKRSASFVHKLRASVSLAGPLTAISRSEHLAELMSAASTCIFRSNASLAVDCSMGGRWSFKVLGGSVSPPKVTVCSSNIVRTASVRPIFSADSGFWRWDGCKLRNAINCPSEELAEKFAASNHCIYLSFPEGWTRALMQDAYRDPSIEAVPAEEQATSVSIGIDDVQAGRALSLVALAEEQSKPAESVCQRQFEFEEDDRQLQDNQHDLEAEMQHALPSSPLSQVSLHSILDEPDTVTSLLVDSVVAQAEADDGSAAQVDRLTTVTEYSLIQR